MVFDKKIIAILVASMGTGILCAISLLQWLDILRMAEQAPPIAELKKTLLKEGELERVHHKVYEKVGEEVWEESVKPDFMRALLLKTISATGNPIPNVTDVINWAKEHKKEANELMERYGSQFRKIKREEIR
jgi:hypothetical protein